MTQGRSRRTSAMTRFSLVDCAEVPDALSLDEPAGLTRTGDAVLFRGSKTADVAIPVATDTPR